MNIKHFFSAANTITASRFVFAALILFIRPLCLAFWVFYALGAASDVLDGYIARTTNNCTERGARLDSIADIVFVFSVIIACVKAKMPPSFIFVLAATVIAVKLISYAAGYIKFRELCAIHTILNKLTGIALFVYPIFVSKAYADTYATIICTVALIAAIEELFIVLYSKAPCRNKKSFFSE